MTRLFRPQHIYRFAALGLLLGLFFAPTTASPLNDVEQAAAQDPRARHIGYGVSVAPFVQSRPDLVDQMGMDWVMIYSSSQLDDYPNQHILYRVDFPYNRNEFEDWQRGLYNLAGELNARGVDAVQLGNEPNLGFEWRGQRIDPGYFTQTMCAGYRIFKEVAPDIVIVGAGIASTITTPDGRAMTDLDFTQQMLNFGGANCFDAFGYHPYGYNQPPEADPGQHELVFRRAERMYRLLWNNGVRDKQVWLTEFGWVRDPAEGGRADCYSDPEFRDFFWMKFDRNTQAAYTARAFSFAETNWPWVGPMILWNLNWSQVEPGALSSCSHMRWYSVITADNEVLPAVQAVATVPKRPPPEYAPTVSAIIHGLTRTAEAGCAGAMRLGSFTVRNSGYPGHLDVQIEAANGPDRPVVWTSTEIAESGTEVEVFVDATGIQPGLHLVAINLRAEGTKRISTHAVRGWLLIHYPSSPECVARYGG